MCPIVWIRKLRGVCDSPSPCLTAAEAFRAGRHKAAELFPCPVDGRKGGLVTANKWLKRWVPRILASPAYQKNGLLIVTFDEAESGSADACCGEGPGPNSPLPGITGLGGGRTGSVLVSPFIKRGSFNDTPYNHYSLLRTVENLFQLKPLGYAADARGFGVDVFGKT